MIKQLTLASIFLLSLTMSSVTSADLIVDFTTAGGQTTVINQDVSSLSFTSEDPSGTGVSFTLTATPVIDPTGGSNTDITGGALVGYNGGLGSGVENTGGFLNIIGGDAEVIEFTISGVTGLAAGQSLVIADLLSQNGSSLSANQGGGYGGTFGQNANDNVTLTSDSGSTIAIAQSDAGDTGSILLNTNNGNNTNTGNTFAHSAGDLAFTNSFTAQLTGPANDAVVIQGFEFKVVSAVPEPSSALVLLGLLGVAACKRRRS